MNTDDKQEFNVNGIVDLLSLDEYANITEDELLDLLAKAKVVRQENLEKLRYEEECKKYYSAKFDEIRVSMGCHWVSCRIINDFVNYLLKLGPDFRDIVHYEEYTGVWSVYKVENLNSYATYQYGTPRCNAPRIIENILNMREIIISDNGKFNESETLMAEEKKKLIIAEFDKWVGQDESRRVEIAREYFKMFDDIYVETGEDVVLELTGINENISLYDYQIKAIKRIIANKNSLLAFDVGVGKTYTMIVSAMELRHSGVSKKNMFVVPNNIVGQWAKMFLNLYPKANILIVEPKFFKPNVRKRVLEDIMNNDYDGIIIAYSCFGMIGVSEQWIGSHLNSKIDCLKEKSKETNDYYNSRVLSNTITRLMKNVNELGRMYNKVGRNLPTFDMLGINTLFIDEAHNFKNIPIDTSLKNLKGINPNGSDKCADMLQKVRIVQSQNNGRGVVMATGTPLSNSISDAYTFQNYLQIERLERLRLDIFDNWVSTFAKLESIWEIDIDGKGIRKVLKFAQFFNLIELAKMFSEISIFHSGDSSRLPQKVNYENIQIKASNNFKKYMYAISKRAENVRSGIVPPSKDNLLKICVDGRKSALDLELVCEVQPNDETSKVLQCANNVYDNYVKYPDTTQIIFCDYSVPKLFQFNVYDKIKKMLVDKGVDSKEIEFIHNASTESKKLELFDKVNNGDVRVLIGSTCKVGIGANVQTRLKAIHHLDVPWRPADMVQRDGRIIRSGNINKEITIYRYIMSGSFDAYSWQILETKQNFISQFLSNMLTTKEISDLEETVFSYAEVKALALDAPEIKQIIMKDNELKNAQIIYMKHKENQNDLLDKINTIDSEVIELTKHIEELKQIKKSMCEIDIDNLKMCLENNKNKLLPQNMLVEVGLELFDFSDMVFVVPTSFNIEKPYVCINVGEVKINIELGKTIEGNIRRIVNFIKNFELYIDKKNSEIADKETIKNQLMLQINNGEEIENNIKRLIYEKDCLLQKVQEKMFVSIG